MKKGTLILLFVFVLPFAVFADDEVDRDAKDEANRDELLRLFEQIAQAQRPARSMKVEWTTETFRWVSGGRSRPETEPKIHHFKTTHTVTLDGIRSRTERLSEVYRGKDGLQRSSPSFETTVYDGRLTRRLQEFPDDPQRTPVGFQDAVDTTSGLKNLFGHRADFTDPRIFDRFTFFLEEVSPNVFILDDVDESGVRQRLTVDGNKSFNITRTELFFRNNRKDEIESTFEEIAAGVWFLSGSKRTHYSLDNEASVDNIIRVVDVELDIEFPDSTFELEFPPGSIPWN